MSRAVRKVRKTSLFCDKLSNYSMTLLYYSIEYIYTFDADIRASVGISLAIKRTLRRYEFLIAKMFSIYLRRDVMVKIQVAFAS